MGFVRVFSQNVSTFVTACRLAVIARRKLPGRSTRRGVHMPFVRNASTQKLEMPWLFTSASSLTPALHIGQSRDG